MQGKKRDSVQHNKVVVNKIALFSESTEEDQQEPKNYTILRKSQIVLPPPLIRRNNINLTALKISNADIFNKSNLGPQSGTIRSNTQNMKSYLQLPSCPNSPYNKRRVSKAERFMMETSILIQEQIENIQKQMLMNENNNKTYKESFQSSPKHLEGIIEETFGDYKMQSPGFSPSNRDKFKNIKPKIDSRNELPLSNNFKRPQNLVDKVLEKEEGFFSQKSRSPAMMSQLDQEQDLKYQQQSINRKSLANTRLSVSQIWDSTTNIERRKTIFGRFSGTELSNIQNQQMNFSKLVQNGDQSFQNQVQQQTKKPLIRLESMMLMPNIDLFDQKTTKNLSTNINLSPIKNFNQRDILTPSSKDNLFNLTKIEDLQSPVSKKDVSRKLQLDLTQLSGEKEKKVKKQKLSEQLSSPKKSQVATPSLNSLNLKDKFEEALGKQVGKMADIKQKEQIMNLGRNEMDVIEYWKQKNEGKIVKLDPEAHKQIESDNFKKEMLMRKGLNKEYEEEFKLLQISKQFERRNQNQNPISKLNKDQVMSSLMATFTNKTYLKQLKKSNNEMERSLNQIGLSYDAYKSLASHLCKFYNFTSERKTLIQRNKEKNQQETMREISDKIQDRVREQGEDGEKFNQLMIEIQRIARGNEIDFSEQSTHITTQRSHMQKSPDFSNSVINSTGNNKHFHIADNIQFKKIMKLLNDWYEAKEPQPGLHLRNHGHSTPISQTPQSVSASARDSISNNSTSSNQNSVKQKRKHQQSPQFRIGAQSAKSSRSQGKSQNVYTSNNPTFSNKQSDQEIQEFSKYINSLLMKSSDKFIKKRYNAFLAKNKKSQKTPDFFKRMEEDQRNRNMAIQVINTMKESGDQYKVSRLKKLSQLTNFVKQRSELSPNGEHAVSMIDLIRLKLDEKIKRQVKKKKTNFLSSQPSSVRDSPKQSIRKHSFSNNHVKTMANVKINLEQLDQSSSSNGDEGNDSVPIIKRDTKAIIQQLKDKRISHQNVKKSVNFDFLIDRDTRYFSEKKAYRDHQISLIHLRNANPIDELIQNIDREVNRKQLQKFNFKIAHR
ncbi:UNKNOWN [Stylonychia lemnae]|uniref:Uncharacterized protein n=1 Tax=Stylonychia lemnae TaxID=5949 RepID=A0A078B480_STYLE|nr:UNKNOWN [Stylonychia lemnae]|eukprot:CDW88012.1 UNKNOWN [Stylonychia lemnae]